MRKRNPWFGRQKPISTQDYLKRVRVYWPRLRFEQEQFSKTWFVGASPLAALRECRGCGYWILSQWSECSDGGTH